jgi:hypothetical protein
MYIIIIIIYTCVIYHSSSFPFFRRTFLPLFSFKTYRFYLWSTCIEIKFTLKLRNRLPTTKRQSVNNHLEFLEDNMK